MTGLWKQRKLLLEVSVYKFAFFALALISASKISRTTTVIGISLLPNNNSRNIPRIDQWKLSPRDSTLTGIVTNHPILEDGDEITTSPLADPGLAAGGEGTVVTTLSGTRYKLKTPKNNKYHEHKQFWKGIEISETIESSTGLSPPLTGTAQNNEEKEREPIIDDWKIDPSNGRIIGTITGHAVLPDGDFISTSPPIETDFKEGSIITTATGSRYELKTPNKKNKAGLLFKQPKPPTLESSRKEIDDQMAKLDAVVEDVNFFDSDMLGAVAAAGVAGVVGINIANDPNFLVSTNFDIKNNDVNGNNKILMVENENNRQIHQSSSSFPSSSVSIVASQQQNKKPLTSNAKVTTEEKTTTKKEQVEKIKGKDQTEKEPRGVMFDREPQQIERGVVSTEQNLLERQPDWNGDEERAKEAEPERFKQEMKRERRFEKEEIERNAVGAMKQKREQQKNQLSKTQIRFEDAKNNHGEAGHKTGTNEKAEGELKQRREKLASYRKQLQQQTQLLRIEQRSNREQLNSAEDESFPLSIQELHTEAEEAKALSKQLEERLKLEEQSSIWKRIQTGVTGIAVTGFSGAVGLVTSRKRRRQLSKESVGETPEVRRLVDASFENPELATNERQTSKPSNTRSLPKVSFATNITDKLKFVEEIDDLLLEVEDLLADVDIKIVENLPEERATEAPSQTSSEPIPVYFTKASDPLDDDPTKKGMIGESYFRSPSISSKDNSDAKFQTVTEETRLQAKEEAGISSEDTTQMDFKAGIAERSPSTMMKQDTQNQVFETSPCRADESKAIAEGAAGLQAKKERRFVSEEKVQRNTQEDAALQPEKEAKFTTGNQERTNAHEAIQNRTEEEAVKVKTEGRMKGEEEKRVHTEEDTIYVESNESSLLEKTRREMLGMRVRQKKEDCETYTEEISLTGSNRVAERSKEKRENVIEEQDIFRAQKRNHECLLYEVRRSLLEQRVKEQRLSFELELEESRISYKQKEELARREMLAARLKIQNQEALKSLLEKVWHEMLIFRLKEQANKAEEERMQAKKARAEEMKTKIEDESIVHQHTYIKESKSIAETEKEAQRDNDEYLLYEARRALVEEQTKEQRLSFEPELERIRFSYGQKEEFVCRKMLEARLKIQKQEFELAKQTRNEQYIPLLENVRQEMLKLRLKEQSNKAEQERVQAEEARTEETMAKTEEESKARAEKIISINVEETMVKTDGEVQIKVGEEAHRKAKSKSEGVAHVRTREEMANDGTRSEEEDIRSETKEQPKTDGSRTEADEEPLFKTKELKDEIEEQTCGGKEEENGVKEEEKGMTEEYDQINESDKFVEKAEHSKKSEVENESQIKMEDKVSITTEKCVAVMPEEDTQIREEAGMELEQDVNFETKEGFCIEAKGARMEVEPEFRMPEESCAGLDEDKSEENEDEISAESEEAMSKAEQGTNAMGVTCAESAEEINAKSEEESVLNAQQEFKATVKDARMNPQQEDKDRVEEARVETKGAAGMTTEQDMVSVEDIVVKSEQESTMEAEEGKVGVEEDLAKPDKEDVVTAKQDQKAKERMVAPEATRMLELEQLEKEFAEEMGIGPEQEFTLKMEGVKAHVEEYPMELDKTDVAKAEEEEKAEEKVVALEETRMSELERLEKEFAEEVGVGSDQESTAETGGVNADVTECPVEPDKEDGMEADEEEKVKERVVALEETRMLELERLEKEFGLDTHATVSDDKVSDGDIEELFGFPNECKFTESQRVDSKRGEGGLGKIRQNYDIIKNQQVAISNRLEELKGSKQDECEERGKKNIRGAKSFEPNVSDSYCAEEIDKNEERQAEQSVPPSEHNLSDNEPMKVADMITKVDKLYTPSKKVLASTPLLMKEIAGVSLENYSCKEHNFFERDVGVYAGNILKIPVRVSAPGSTVEFSIEKKSYEFSFGIDAFLDEGHVVKIKDMSSFRKRSETQKILVPAGSAPCMMQFKIANNYSTLLEKARLGYKIRVTPPSVETIKLGRRRRTRSCLQFLETEIESQRQLLKSTAALVADLDRKKRKLQEEINEKASKIESIRAKEEGLKKSISDSAIGFPLPNRNNSNKYFNEF